MEVPTVSYEEGRSWIKSGDIVFIRDNTTLVSAIIRWATHSVYSHVGIAFWIHVGGRKRLMMVESQGRTRKRVVNMSFYKGKNLDVVCAPKDWKDTGHTALDRLGVEKYSYIEALYAGYREFMLKHLNIYVPERDFKGQICSEFVAHVYDLPEQHVSPQILAEQLLTMGYNYAIKIRK